MWIGEAYGTAFSIIVKIYLCGDGCWILMSMSKNEVTEDVFYGIL